MPEKTRQVIYRPDCNQRGECPNYYEQTFSFYTVTHGHEVVFAYICSYFSVGEVIADVIARNDNARMSLTGDAFSMDFVVWNAYMIMASVHQDVVTDIFKVVRYDEEGNGYPGYVPPFDGWPTHAEWVAAGRPDPIVLTPADLARNRARADADRSA